MRRLLYCSAVLLTACNGDKIARLENKNKELDQKLQELTAALAAKSARTIVPDNEVYTLYRSSGLSTDLRVHVGTFDSRSFIDPSQNKQYNYEICSDAQLNFNQRNKGRSVRFWCEEGRFREKLP